MEPEIIRLVNYFQKQEAPKGAKILTKTPFL